MEQTSTRAVSPLRQRMIDDMRMRKLGDKTQAAYIRAVRQLAAFLGRSPDSAGAEDLRRWTRCIADAQLVAAKDSRGSASAVRRISRAAFRLRDRFRA